MDFYLDDNTLLSQILLEKTLTVPTKMDPILKASNNIEKTEALNTSKLGTPAKEQNSKINKILHLCLINKFVRR